MTWTLSDGDGIVINGREHVALTPAASATVQISGDDLQILVGEAAQDVALRYLTVEVIYDSKVGENRYAREEFAFLVNNLHYVSGTIAGGAYISQALIEVVDQEYTVWEARDSTGTVVAKATVSCSVLDEGTQTSVINFYTIYNGTLGKQYAIEGNE
jgi:hypothetical protein